MANSLAKILCFGVLVAVATYVEGQAVSSTTLDPEVAAKVANSLPSLHNLYVALIATGAFLALATSVIVINYFRYENRRARSGEMTPINAPSPAKQEPEHVYDNIGMANETAVQSTSL